MCFKICTEHVHIWLYNTNLYRKHNSLFWVRYYWVNYKQHIPLVCLTPWPWLCCSAVLKAGEKIITKTELLFYIHLQRLWFTAFKVCKMTCKWGFFLLVSSLSLRMLGSFNQPAAPWADKIHHAAPEVFCINTGLNF